MWLLICLIIEHGAGKWVRRSEGADRYLGKYLGRKLRTTQVVLLLINQRCCTITEKAPTRAFTWLKAATTAFTFKTLLRHYAKRALTPRSLNVKLGLGHKSHKGRAVWLA